MRYEGAPRLEVSADAVKELLAVSEPAGAWGEPGVTCHCFSHAASRRTLLLRSPVRSEGEAQLFDITDYRAAIPQRQREETHMTATKKKTTAKKAVAKKPATAKKTTITPAKKTASKQRAFEVHSAASVVRWMGVDGFKPTQARAALADMGLTFMKESSVPAWLSQGRRDNGKVAELTATQQNYLRRFREEVQTDEVPVKVAKPPARKPLTKAAQVQRAAK